MNLKSRLVEKGLTEIEALGAVAILKSIKEFERIINTSEYDDFIDKVIFEGVEDMTTNQRAVVEGFPVLTELESRRYLQRVYKNMSALSIAKVEGVGERTVERSIIRAKRKLALAKNGKINWKDDKRVREILSTMTDRKKEYFNLYFVQGLTYDDMAKKLNVSSWTARDIILTIKSDIHNQIAKMP